MQNQSFNEFHAVDSVIWTIPKSSPLESAAGNLKKPWFWINLGSLFPEGEPKFSLNRCFNEFPAVDSRGDDFRIVNMTESTAKNRFLNSNFVKIFVPEQEN